jgi:hypothetical protein
VTQTASAPTLASTAACITQFLLKGKSPSHRSGLQQGTVVGLGAPGSYRNPNLRQRSWFPGRAHGGRRVEVNAEPQYALLRSGGGARCCKWRDVVDSRCGRGLVVVSCLDDDGSCAGGGEAGAVGGDVFDGVGGLVAGVEDDVADDLTVEEGLDAEIAVGLRAGDGSARVRIRVAVDLDDRRDD